MMKIQVVKYIVEFLMILIYNNIYSSSGNYYYLPSDGDELKIFASYLDITNTYQSGTEYFDKVIDENDRVIDELEKSLEETERLYGRLW